MTHRFSPLRNAFALLPPRWIAAQIALALLVCVLCVAWLRVPDSSPAYLAATVLLGMIILALAGGGEAALLLWLSRRPLLRSRLIVGTLAVLLGVALWFGWSTLLDHFVENDPLWGGYLNSRFPPTWRNLFSYPHLLTGMYWCWTLLQWFGEGLLFALVGGLVVSSHPLRATKDTVRSVVYWITLIAGLYLLDTCTGWLANWTPGHGIVVEMLSLLLRMVALVSVDGVIASFILAVLAACLTRYETPAGTPEESQPLTAEAP